MTANYLRSQVMSYFDLPSTEQEKQRSEMDYLTLEELESEAFVHDPVHQGEYIPLSMFMRTGSNFVHGIYGISYFSCYTLTIGRTGEDAVVAYRYW